MIRADVNISDQGWWKGSFAGFFGYRQDVPFFTLPYIESRDLWLPLRVPLPEQYAEGKSSRSRTTTGR